MKIIYYIEKSNNKSNLDWCEKGYFEQKYIHNKALYENQKDRLLVSGSCTNVSSTELTDNAKYIFSFELMRVNEEDFTQYCETNLNKETILTFLENCKIANATVINIYIAELSKFTSLTEYKFNKQ